MVASRATVFGPVLRLLIPFAAVVVLLCQLTLMPSARSAGPSPYRLTLPGLAGDSVPPTAPDALPVVWHFGAGVTSEQQQWLREALSDAAARAYELYGALPPSMDVFAIADLDVLAQTWVSWQADHGSVVTLAAAKSLFSCDKCSVTPRGAMFMRTGPSFFVETFPQRAGRQTVAHEYFHALQHEAVAARANAGPVWLREGAAEWFGWSTAALHADAPLATVISSQKAVVRAEATSLQSMETDAGYFAAKSPYPISFSATAFLVDGASSASLLEFYRSLTTAVPWQTTFQSVFHISVDEFYRKFEAYRAK